MERERREHAIITAAADSFIAAVDTTSVANAATAALVPDFADWAVLYVPDRDGALAAVSTRHHSMAKTDLGVLIDRRYPTRAGDASIAAAVFEAGEPVFVPHANAEYVRSLAHDADHAAVLTSLALRSFLAVPIAIDDSVQAVLLAMRSENPHDFDGEDLEFLQRFAARTALAFESSRAYERDRTIALTLQRALLPGTLPSVHGFHFSASYSPASNESLIGGDWYDAFLLPGGRICLSIGDVVGHGLEAATIMSALRQGLRFLADRCTGPADLLRQLNNLLITQQFGRLATALVVEIDPATRQVTMANAGHPYPILIHADGAAEVLHAAGVMLGVMHDAEYHESHVRMQPGESIALYTDGYIEHARDAIAGELQLIEALQRSRQLPDPAPQVHLDLLGSDAPSDDAALLIASALGADPTLYLRVPAKRESVSSVRPAVRRFLAVSGLDETRQFEMLVAVGEAVINAVEHAYNGTRGDVVIRGHVDGSEVGFDIEDFGRWNGGRVAEEQRGYGLPLMHAFARVASIDRKATGTCVRLSSRLDGHAGDHAGHEAGTST
jgi:anti-sigma regulatory factor (Ser/Thr protein kinase)